MHVRDVDMHASKSRRLTLGCSQMASARSEPVKAGLGVYTVCLSVLT